MAGHIRRLLSCFILSLHSYKISTVTTEQDDTGAAAWWRFRTWSRRFSIGTFLIWLYKITTDIQCSPYPQRAEKELPSGLYWYAGFLLSKPIAGNSLSEALLHSAALKEWTLGTHYSFVLKLVGDWKAFVLHTANLAEENICWKKYKWRFSFEKGYRRRATAWHALITKTHLSDSLLSFTELFQF